MQRIIKDRQVVDDRWHLLPKDATLESVPNSDDVIIPLALWLEHGPALRGRDGGLGVWLDADEEPESIAGDLDRFQVIAVNFPAFTDGRGFSSARCCASATATRARSARSATCCATSCSSCAAAASTPMPSRADRSPEDALASLDDFSEVYQTSVEQPLPLFRRRG